MSWKSPLDITFSDMQLNFDNEICRAVQKVGITVDKDELIKALKYDRGQYDKGYADAKSELEEDDLVKVVRCKDCRYGPISLREDVCRNSWCGMWVHNGTDFCSYGERRDE